jgi:hypothetical protein
MNIELIQRVLREKRVQHPELVDPLSWQFASSASPGGKRSDSSSRRGINPPASCSSDGRWTIVIDSRLYSRHHTSYARTSSRTSGCTSINSVLGATKSA